MDKPIKTGMTAFGMSGLVFHGPLLTASPHFELTKVYQRSSDSAKQKYPQINIVKDLAALLDDPELELIIVNTPDVFHFKMAKAALEKGKHVVVEKPFTMSVEEADTLIELADAKNLILSVFQNRRWDGDFLTVQQVVNSGMLGRLVEFETHFDRYRNFVQENTWKEAEGLGTGGVYNLGSHMIDQVLLLFGMPEAVTADMRITRTGGNVIDYFEIWMHYAEVKAIVKSGYLVREQGPRYALHGTEGSFIKYGLDPQEEMLKAGFLPIDNDWGAESEDEWGVLNTQTNGLHVDGFIETKQGDYPAYYQNIYEAIRQGKPLSVTAIQGRNVIQIIEASITSHQEKRTVVL